MKYQIEFKGRKLGQTECNSFSEARSIMYKIVRQCVATYREMRANKKFDQDKENRLQSRILAQLKIQPIASSIHVEKPKNKMMATAPNVRLSQIHRSYAEVG